MTSGAEIGVRLLREAGARLDPGLTEVELRSIEARYGFVFDHDHRELLSLAYPVGYGWPDWRDGSREDLQRRLDWPVEGVIWDMHHNDFWPRPWGRRPLDAMRAEGMARRKMKRMPKLVPVYSHRFMAAGPSRGSAPVFSVMQADVVYLGENLPSCIARELKVSKTFETGVHRHVAFWSSLAEGDTNYLNWPHEEARAFRNLNIEGEPFFPPKPDAAPDAPPVTWESFQVGNREEAATVARREGARLRNE